MTALKVSIDTYDEIATVLEANGRKLSDAKQIILEKTDKIETTVNYKQVTIRRDIAEIASKTYNHQSNQSFVEYVNELYQYVLTGELPTTVEVKSNNWK